MAGSNLIYIVDDDQGVRLSLAMLLRAHGFETHSFGAATDFFHSTTNKNISHLTNKPSLMEFLPEFVSNLTKLDLGLGGLLNFNDSTKF